MVVASTMYAIAWLLLSFTFPLIGVLYHYSYFLIGLLGMTSNIPFFIAALIYLRSNVKMLNIGMRVTPYAVAAITVVFFFMKSNLFIMLLILSSFIQAFFWISIEISLSFMEGSGNAEKYSISWGFPMAIAPIIAGIVIQDYGFPFVFIISVFFFIMAGLFSPKIKQNVEKRASTKLNIALILPLMFSGMSLGFALYVLIPFLKTEGFSYIIVGAIEAIFSITQALMFLVLNFVKKNNIVKFSVISALFSSSPLFLFFGINIYSVFVLVTMAGVGSSIAFSKVLSYTSASMSPRKGIFYYEFFSAIGFGIGSSVDGAIFQFLKLGPAVIIFTVPIIYAIVLVASNNIKKSYKAIKSA
ncbi:MAG: hypothetical protein ACP5UV_04680 [Thermoplasmata archaeon]